MRGGSVQVLLLLIEIQSPRVTDTFGEQDDDDVAVPLTKFMNLQIMSILLKLVLFN